MKNKAHIIRISLFKIASIEEIHMAVKQAWISEYNKRKNLDTFGKNITCKLEFLPELIRGIANTNCFSFVEIKNVMAEKPVTLVFDDLERCCLETVDILGMINEYCENQNLEENKKFRRDKYKSNKKI